MLRRSRCKLSWCWKKEICVGGFHLYGEWSGPQQRSGLIFPLWVQTQTQHTDLKNEIGRDPLHRIDLCRIRQLQLNGIVRRKSHLWFVGGRYRLINNDKKFKFCLSLQVNKSWGRGLSWYSGCRTHQLMKCFQWEEHTWTPPLPLWSTVRWVSCWTPSGNVHITRSHRCWHHLSHYFTALWTQPALERRVHLEPLRKHQPTVYLQPESHWAPRWGRRAQDGVMIQAYQITDFFFSLQKEGDGCCVCGSFLFLCSRWNLSFTENVIAVSFLFFTTAGVRGWSCGNCQ